MTTEVSIQQAHELLQRLRDAVNDVIVGKAAEVDLALIGMAAHGHLLIEDVPGVGKTMLAKSLARAAGCTFKRIQFTPDLLPTDVTGVSVYNQRTANFEFRPGPVFANLVLADEINRATPKTQSSLLEAMEERQVTVDGVTRELPAPFMVLATQNPIEYEGTFPLPEAQLDRFLLRIHLGYPSTTDEVAVLEHQMLRHPIESLEPVASTGALKALQRSVREVHVHTLLSRYIVEVTAGTRKHPDVYLGASPRGSLALLRASQARALMDNRDYVIPDDVKALAPAVLSHRLIVHPEARMRSMSPQAIVQQVLAETPVPGNRVPHKA